MTDGFSARYGDLLYGSYDCVDRIVLNAYYPLVTTRAASGPGGDACMATMSSWTMRT